MSATPATLRDLRSAIMTAVGHGTEFGEVAERHGVTWSLVYALAFELENHSICATCTGSGKVLCQNGAALGRCEDCSGQGCLPSQTDPLG